MKRILFSLLAALLGFGVCFAAMALALRPKPLAIGAVDPQTVEDGVYVGVCQNKILFAAVQVKVRDHAFTDIDVLWHKESYMPQARFVAEQVCAKQTLQIDALSGATFTRDTVLKAIETALRAEAVAPAF